MRTLVFLLIALALIPAFFDEAVAQSTDPFVAAVNEKTAEINRNAGVFSDQLLRDHAQIAELTKQVADLKDQLDQMKKSSEPPMRPHPQAAAPEAK